MSRVVAGRPTPLHKFLSTEPYLPPHPAGEDELIDLANGIRQASRHYYDPITITRRQEALEGRFQTLSDQWREATRFESSVEEMIAHPAYQAIIRLGRPILPLLLRELEQRPAYLFMALRAITRADPVRPEDRGRFPQMRQAWLQWARDQGITW